MEHVVNVVGGAEAREKYGGQPGPRFVPLTRSRQKAAVTFLNHHAFTTPTFFLDTRVLRRMEPEGTLKRIGSAQSRILVDLLDGDRLARLSDYEALAGKAGSRNGKLRHRPFGLTGGHAQLQGPVRPGERLHLFFRRLGHDLKLGH